MLSQHLELFTAPPHYASLLFTIVLFYRTIIIMSSFLDVTLTIAPLDVPESFTASCTKKKGKKSALVWAYTRQPLEGEDATLLYCAYCLLGDEDKLPYGSDTLSAMTKHI
jgi:hypothetical protein